MITDEQRKKLLAALPADRVAERTQAGRALSYVEGWWVIGQLNEIFGPGGWGYDVTTREVHRAEEQSEKGKRWRVSYSARCVLTIPGCPTITDVGHGHGIDRDCGNAVESAEKEAATDALKRAAKSLGWRLGLALYDKAQEHVEEERAEPARSPTLVPRTSEQLAAIVAEWGTMSSAERAALWASMTPADKEAVKAARAAKESK